MYDLIGNVTLRFVIGQGMILSLRSTTRNRIQKQRTSQSMNFWLTSQYLLSQRIKNDKHKYYLEIQMRGKFCLKLKLEKILF